MNKAGSYADRFQAALICGIAMLTASCRISPGPEPADRAPPPGLETSARQLDVTVDIGDDFWRSRGRLSEENIRQQMLRFAELGLRRVYWLVAPELETTGRALRDDGDGWAAFRAVVKAAHDAGLEIFPVLKPLETGHVSAAAPHNAVLPPGSMRGETLTGPTTSLSEFLVRNPQYRTWRRPGWDAGEGMVATIKLVSGDDSDIDLERDDLHLWSSTINGDFKPYRDSFGLRSGVEERDGRLVSVLSLTGLNIPASERYLLVTASRHAVEPVLSNRASRLMELYDGDGRIIPSTADQGPYTRELLLNRLRREWLRATGEWGVPDEAMPAREYGSSPELQGYRFDLDYGDAVRRLDSSEPGHGYIAAVRGKSPFMNIPQPLHPEVRDWWLSQVRRLVECGIDGIDFRISNHSSWNSEPLEYGFGPVVQQAYREKYGLELLSADFDELLWRRLQGDAYTDFLRRARDVARAAGIAVQVHVAAPMGAEIPGWRRNNVPGHIEWQWRRWIEDDLADSVLLKLLPWWWGSAAGAGADFAEEIIAVAREAGKDVSWEWRFDCWWLTAPRPGLRRFTEDDLRRILERRKWGWKRTDLSAIVLYEGFDFIYMNPDTGETAVSPAFKAILEAVRNDRADELRAEDLETRVDI